MLVLMGLLAVIAVIVAIFFYLIKKTNVVELEAARRARASGYMHALSAEETIRLTQAKMLNGGYRAYTVEYSPSNSDV